jgi:fermentation-respiration switch protein FrsA (DUF1100 family)
MSPQSRVARLAALAVLVAATWWPAAVWLPSADEAFWLLLPVWAAAGWLLRAIPRPRWPFRSRIASRAAAAAVVLIPIAAYLVMASLLGGRVSLPEIAIAVWFFAASLEILLLYAFGAADALRDRLRRGKGRARALAAAVAPRLILYLLLIPFLYATFSIHRVKIPPRAPDPDYGMAFEDVSFPSRGPRPVTLRGWFFPLAGARGTAIACHGLAANRADILYHVAILREAGLQVLAFDFRGHGESDGHRISFGSLEREDVLGAFEYLASRKDVDPDRIVGFGVSMGAASLLLALGDLPGMRGAVADSAFDELSLMVRHQFRFLPGFPGDGLAAITELFGRMECGAWAGDVSPAKAIGRARIPILFIHGLDDPMVPPGCTSRLHAGYRGPKRLLTVSGAGHGQSAMLAPGHYEKELEWFLDEALGGRSASWR